MSSTYLDLIQERQAVQRAILQLNHIPAGMELFAAGDADAWTLIERVIRRSDIYLLIVGGRYGSLDDSGLSFTEKEYSLATELGKPVIALLHHNPNELPRSRVETDAAGWQKLQDFLARVRKAHTCGFWRSADELMAAALVALIQTAQDVPGGWVRVEAASSGEPDNPPKPKYIAPALIAVNEALIRNIEELDRRYQAPETLSGFPTGFADLDRVTSGFRPGELVVIAGRPESGLRSMAFHFTLKVAELGLPVLVVSMNRSADAVSKKLLSILSFTSEHALSNGVVRDEDWPRLTHAVSKLQGMQIVIDAPVNADAAYIRTACAEVKGKYGALASVVIDEGHLIDPDNPAGRSTIGRFLKRLARELGTAVVLTTLVSRKIEVRPNKRPMLQDLDGDLPEMADSVIFTYDDSLYNLDSPDRGTVEVIIGRNAAGPVGATRLTRFNDILGNLEGVAPKVYAGE